jgi:hypothetical protein
MKTNGRSTICSTVITIIGAVLLSAPAGAQPAEPDQPASLSLSAGDEALLARGEISDARSVTGGVTALLVGFGTGHVIEGRWRERGWWFTLGDSVLDTIAFGSLLVAADCAEGDCHSQKAIDGVTYGALIAALGFRLWETYDAVVVPREQNARIQQLRARAPGNGLAPYIAPTRGSRGDAAVAGLQLRF